MMTSSDERREVAARATAVHSAVWDYMDGLPDAALLAHGLVRLPVDADGVTIRVGDVIAQDGKSPRRVVRIETQIMTNLGVGFNAAVAEQFYRHVKDDPEPEPEPTPDTPASLADELLAAHDRCVESGDVRGFEAEVTDVAERLRRMGGGDGADD